MLTSFKNIDGLTTKAKKSLREFVTRIKEYTIDEPCLSKRIESSLDLSGAEVRAIVSYLRTIGQPIGSNCHGYFRAQRPEDLDTTIAHLRERRNKLNEVIAGLEKTQDDMRQAKRRGELNLLFNN